MTGFPSGEPCYGTRVDEALALAAAAFRTKRRKGNGVPYLTHLLQVMVTVGEHGGDEDQLIAAVLHDYLEDIDGASRDALEERFGVRVARLVHALSDTTTRPKPPWEGRKRAYLQHLSSAPADVKLISAADKLHNASSIVRDYAVVGDELWGRFSVPRERTLWYYRAVVGSLARGWTHPLLSDVEQAVRRMHQLADEPYRRERVD